MGTKGTQGCHARGHMSTKGAHILHQAINITLQLSWAFEIASMFGMITVGLISMLLASLC